MSTNDALREALLKYATENPGTYIVPGWDGDSVRRALVASKPEPQAQAGEPSSADFEQIIDNHLDGYELRCDEGDHAPTDFERLLIKDAIMGLLVDEAWDKAWGEHISSLAAALLAADKPAESGGEAWEPTEEQFADWCERHGMQPTDREAFRDAASLYLSYTHPQPSALPAEVVKDAERYRGLRDKGHGNTSRGRMAWIATGSLRDGVAWVSGEKADAAVDAMLKEGKNA